jgi:UDP-3-O-[3-hydroxymyristoyl] N-acetylglucosamine deacetylase
MTKTENFFTSPASYRIQKTLKEVVHFKGVGLHTGAQAKLTLIPAEPNHGIRFIRKDLKEPAQIFAHYDAVVATELATTLGYSDRPSVRIGTVEHILAALFAAGITNLLVEVTGPEIPILDGSSAIFLDAFFDAGIELQSYSTSVIRVIKPIKVYKNGAVCELLPRDRLRLTTSVDFPHPSIGLQTYALEMTPGSFRDEIGRARTFGFVRDLERLRSMQLAQGASVENVLAFTEDGILNEDGMRFADECVRHKILDAVGDLALCGSWIEGELVSYRGGHSIHLELLKSLKSFRSHWELSSPMPLGTGQGTDHLSSISRIT